MLDDAIVKRVERIALDYCDDTCTDYPCGTCKRFALLQVHMEDMVEEKVERIAGQVIREAFRNGGRLQDW